MAEDKKPRCAEPIYSDLLDKWEIHAFIGKDIDDYQIKYFGTESEAETFQKKHTGLNNIQKKKLSELLANDVTFLEKMATEEPRVTDEELNNLPEGIDKVSEKIEQHKKDFDETKLTYETLAKQALIKLADSYLSAEQIEKHEWVKFKMQIQGMSLATVLFQLDASHKAIYKLTELIHTGPPIQRNWEVLQQLQRVTLDTAKYLNEMVNDLEDSVKKIRDDLEETAMYNDSKEGEEGSEKGLVYRKKTELIKELRVFTSEIKVYKTPETKNPRLRGEEVLGEEVSYEELHESPKEKEEKEERKAASEEDIKSGNTGLETWADDGDTDEGEEEE